MKKSFQCCPQRCGWLQDFLLSIWPVWGWSVALFLSPLSCKDQCCDDLKCKQYFNSREKHCLTPPPVLRVLKSLTAASTWLQSVTLREGASTKLGFLTEAVDCNFCFGTTSDGWARLSFHRPPALALCPRWTSVRLLKQHSVLSSWSLIFPVQSHSSQSDDLRIDILMATLADTWYHQVCTETGLPSVSILWLGELKFDLQRFSLCGCMWNYVSRSVKYSLHVAGMWSHLEIICWQSVQNISPWYSDSFKISVEKLGYFN